MAYLSENSEKTSTFNVTRNLYRDSDFAPVDYHSIETVQCICHHGRRYAIACTIHGRNSTWTPPTVLRRTVCIRDVPENTPHVELEKCFNSNKDRSWDQTLFHRYGQNNINDATSSLDEFTKNFKVTEQHKKHEEHYLREMQSKMCPPTTDAIEEVPVTDQPANPGLWKRIRKGFKSIGQRKAGDEQNRKWFSFRKRQNVAPVETQVEEVAKEQPIMQHADSINTVSSSSVGKDSNYPPSVEELQARSASFKFDPFNPSGSVHSGWEVASYYNYSLPGSFRLLENNQASHSRRGSQTSSVSQPARPKPKYSPRKSMVQ